MTLAVVEENVRALADGVHNQIEVAIAVYIGKRGAGASAPGAGNTGFGGDIRKFPIAEIAVENVVAVDAAKINITPAVAIHIARGHAGAVEENLIRDVTFEREDV